MSAVESKTGQLMEIFDRLCRRFGPQHWWPGDTRFEMIVGAILTQSIAWTGVEVAMSKLREAGALDPASLREIHLDELAGLVYASGYYNAKARKIKAFVEHLQRYDDDLDALFSQDASSLRAELLSIHGVGEETADSIILYAAHKPAFVIDAYTRRIVDRVGVDMNGESYEAYQRLFTDELPRDVKLFNEYHALFVKLGKDFCKTKPLCTGCPISEVCDYGRRAASGG